MSFFEVKVDTRDENLVYVLPGKETKVLFRYDDEAQRAVLVTIEIPTAAVHDGVSPEKYLGKQRLDKARRSVERYFIGKEVKIQKGETPQDADRFELWERKAKVLSPWLAASIDPLSMNRVSDKVLRSHLYKFKDENPDWTESVDELLKIVRSVRAKKATDSRVQNEQKAARAARRTAKAAYQRKQKEAQGDLFSQ